MSFMLPPSGSHIRGLFDMEHLVEVTKPENIARLPDLMRAWDHAETLMRIDEAIDGVNMFLVEKNTLFLVRFYNDDRVNFVWEFGPINGGSNAI